MRQVIFAFALILFLGHYSQAQEIGAGDFTGLPPAPTDSTGSTSGSIDPISLGPVSSGTVTDPVATTPVVSDPVASTDPLVTAPVPDSGSGTPVATTPDDGSTSSPSDDGDGSGKGHHGKKAKKPNFGMIVRAEAHRLKAEGLNGKQKMGGWVSDQRRQSESKTVSSNSKSSGGSGAGGANPTVAMGNSGKGQSGNHKK